VPIPLDVQGRRVVVVGGPAATRRITASLAADGADVELVADHAAGAALDAALDRELPDRALPDLVLWVEGDPVRRAAVAEACRAERVWFQALEGTAPTPLGHVTLVGGGPGDPALMTVGARTALAEADVVLHDRLGPTDDLAAFAPGAELIDVGKTPGHHAVPQRRIEELLVEHASRGLRVVRLKGGDPFVFGRGGEEVIACRAAGVPVTVVPGVTSAIAVPAAAGIPVTHREVSRAFTVVSGHVPFSEDELSHLVGLGGTLVVLMGVGTLPHLVAGLQRHGMRADMPLAIVERGYAIDQRTTVTTVSGVAGLLGTVAPRSPAVIVVGEVVRVPGWAEEAAAAGHAPWEDGRRARATP
jgi:uroporphyrin-III C-methyltransferase